MLIPQVVAHRGASAYESGNTLRAFRLAAQQRANYIEFDVHLTRDRQILIRHDWAVLVDGNSVPLIDLTLTELQSYFSQLSEGTNSEHSTEDYLLTLPRLVDWARGTEVGLMVEIKNAPIRYPEIASEVAILLLECGLLDRSFLISFDHEILLRAKLSNPNIRTGLLYVARLSNLTDTLQFTNADLIVPHNDFLTEDVVYTAHQAGVQVCSWSTSEMEQIDRLCQLGVDMICTDCPDRARAQILVSTGNDLDLR